MKRKWHLNFQDFVTSSLTVVYLLVGTSMNIQIETVHKRDPVIHRQKHYFEAFCCSQNFNILCRKRAEQLSLDFFVIVKTSVERKTSDIRLPHSRKGCFSPQRRGRALTFCLHSLGIELFWFKCRQEIHSRGFSYCMLFSCRVQSHLAPFGIFKKKKTLYIMWKELVIWGIFSFLFFFFFFATTKSPHQPTWSIKCIWQKQCCSLKRVGASSWQRDTKHIDSVKRKHVFPGPVRPEEKESGWDGLCNTARGKHVLSQHNGAGTAPLSEHTGHVIAEKEISISAGVMLKRSVRTLSPSQLYSCGSLKNTCVCMFLEVLTNCAYFSIVLIWTSLNELLPFSLVLCESL